MKTRSRKKLFPTLFRVFPTLHCRVIETQFLPVTVHAFQECLSFPSRENNPSPVLAFTHVAGDCRAKHIAILYFVGMPSVTSAIVIPS